MKLPLNHQITHVTAVLDFDNLSGEGLSAQPVIEQARRLARRTRSALTIVAFQAPPSLLSSLQSLVGETEPADARRAGRPDLFGLARRLQHEEGISVHCEMIESQFDATMVTDWITASPTDLLVLAKPDTLTPAATVFDGLSQLIRQSGVPVWFAEQGRRPRSGVVAAVSGNLYGPRRELRALDQEVLDAARGIGTLFDADLHLVQATSRPGTMPGLGGFAMLDGTGSHAQAMHKTRLAQEENLAAKEKSLASFARATGVAEEVDQLVVAAGEIAEVVSGSAQALQAGLIVMGACDKTRWETIIRGGAAEATLALAPCDVLYVKDSAGEHDVRPQALLSGRALDEEPEPEEVDLLVSPRRHFATPLAVVREESLRRRIKVMVLEAWEEELQNEARNELRMPQQVYEEVVDPAEIEEVRRALDQLGARSRTAA